MGTMTEINWKRYPGNPIHALAPKPDSWREDATMTIDIITDVKNKRFLGYYNGKQNSVNRFGLTTCPFKDFDGLNWTDYSDNPIIGPGPESFDSRHTIDPASVLFKNKIFLYYSALGDEEDSIGLATSNDGIQFEKHTKPVIVGRSPEIVLYKNLLYLFYILKNEKGGYEFHLATSADGYNFQNEGPIFLPSKNGWDSFSILTARIFYENGIFILTYAGDDIETDRPKYFGMAFSTELRTWVKYSKNPIFGLSPTDSWESKGIWFPEIVHSGNKFYMFYEGNDGEHSQIGLAISEDPIVEIGRHELVLD